MSTCKADTHSWPVGIRRERLLIFRRVESEGLAHWSYILGSKVMAVVVDPRRDFEVYVKIARRGA